MKYVWQDKYNTGIAVIDNQHQELFRIINRLESSIESTIVENEFDEILKAIYEYAKYHFVTEECFFEDSTFENKDNHIKLHRDFIQQLDHFITDDFTNREKQNDLYDFLSAWIIEHVLIEDQQYVGKI